MLTSSHSQALSELITKYVTEHELVPAGKQLHVSFELRPVPAAPVVIIAGQQSMSSAFSISKLGLSTRVFGALNNGGYVTVADLLGAVEKAGSPAPFLRLRNFGRLSLKELRSCLESSGFELCFKWGR